MYVIFDPLDTGLMKTAVKAGQVEVESVDDLNDSCQSKMGQKVLDWIEAYSSASGNARSCWVGGKKKLVCMTWRDADSSDDEGA
jgi:hypothetical protein